MSKKFCIIYSNFIFYILLLFFSSNNFYGQCVSGDCKNGNGSYKYGDGGFYEGDFSNGLENGKGRLIFSSGSSYQGEFKNGKLYGKGVKKYINGDILEGDFVNGDCIYGTYVYSTGAKYIGTFSNSNLELGTYIWPDGDKYIGPFLKNNLHGEGIKVLKSGEIIEGVWSNGTLVEQKKKEPSPQNKNLIHSNSIISKSKSSDLLASIELEFPDDFIERKKTIDKEYSELNDFIKTRDSIKFALDVYKPIFTKDLDVETYKKIMDNKNVFYIINKHANQPYNDKVKKLSEIRRNGQN